MCVEGLEVEGLGVVELMVLYGICVEGLEVDNGSSVTSGDVTRATGYDSGALEFGPTS